MTSARASQAELAHAVGSRLRQLRRAAKLTQRQVADQVPMSAANLSRIENGEQGPPSDEVIERLARILDTEAVELLALAGRTSTNTNADALLRELRQLRTEIRDGFARVEAALLHRP
ncbi:MAG: helix-turn-helix transcriptional regulator [Solirubrobacteraceae bacterium]